MAELNEKGMAFKAGDQLSARALNNLRNATLRSLTGGAGVIVEKYGDRVVIRLEEDQGGKVGRTAIATITDDSNDTYLVCDIDGAVVNVAKPWGLRGGSVWPTGPDYTQTGQETRDATQTDADDIETTEHQQITPSYEVGEEILAVRLPNARILVSGDFDDLDDAGVQRICWTDLNTAGRCWATVEDGTESVPETPPADVPFVSPPDPPPEEEDGS